MAGSGSCPFLELRILGKCGCLGRGSSTCEQVIMGAWPQPALSLWQWSPSHMPSGCFCRSITALHLFTDDRLAHPVCDRMLAFLRLPLLYYAGSGIEPTALAVLGRTPA